MSPPSASEVAELPVLGNGKVSDDDTSAVISQDAASFPRPPTFKDKYEERAYLKGRLVLAYRLFAKNGFDEGVAGHITIRVRKSPNNYH